MRRTPVPNHPSAITMRVVWGLAMARIVREEIAKCTPWTAECERHLDMRSADGHVAAARRRQAARRNGDWRRR